jgi:hypothetical protein
MKAPNSITRPLLCLAAVFLIGPPLSARTGLREFAAEHCFDCHDSATHKAGLDLEKLDVSLAGKDALAWEAVFDRVSRGEMPPQKKAQPKPEESAGFLDALGKGLRAASLARQAKEGRGPVRRMTRAEFETTVNDLLHIHTDLRSLFPEDAVTAGFDKVGEGLTLSAAHFAAYQTAAEKALNMASERGGVVDMDEDGAALFARDEKTFTGWGSWLEGDTMVLTSRLLYPNRSVYSLPAPRSGRYRVTLSVQARNAGGLTLPVALGIHDVRAPKPGDNPDTALWIDASEDQARTVTTELELDARQQIHVFGPTLEPGLKVNKMTQNGEWWTGRALLIRRFKVEGPLKPDGTLDEWPSLSYRELFGDLDTQPRSKATGVPAVKGKPEPLFAVSSSPKEDAARLLRRFIPKAFRRPVAEDIAADFVAMAHASLDSGVPFHRVMLDSYKAVLSSPYFFLLHADPGALDGHSIATRLSYFLWNSAPDDALLLAAAKGDLATREGRAAQVERLLKDVRAERFERSFVDQWLDLKNINATTPDGVLYAEIPLLMTTSAEQETRRFFHELLTEDRSALETIQSNWTYVNELLSALYDLPEVRGYELRKVALPPQARRGGFLTQASILKVTADGAKTSPIIRGKWVNERILGVTPPNPPDDVPKIEPDIRGATTIREQLAKHRSTPACMSCHTIIDPPGFALETFDVMGGWRDFYRMPKSTGAAISLTRFNNRRANRGPAVERGYTMPDGRSFADITEYKALLLEDSERIVSALAAKLLTYATGAPVQFADREDIAAVVSESRAQNFGVRSLIHAIVQSRPFLHK